MIDLSKIISKFDYLSPEQAKAILELRLQRLTGLEREKVEKDLVDESKKLLSFYQSYPLKLKLKISLKKN